LLSLENGGLLVKSCKREGRPEIKPLENGPTFSSCFWWAMQAAMAPSRPVIVATAAWRRSKVRASKYWLSSSAHSEAALHTQRTIYSMSFLINVSQIDCTKLSGHRSGRRQHKRGPWLVNLYYLVLRANVYTSAQVMGVDLKQATQGTLIKQMIKTCSSFSNKWSHKICNTYKVMPWGLTNPGFAE
jgi:hypothetical protein